MQILTSLNSVSLAFNLGEEDGHARDGGERRARVSLAVRFFARRVERCSSRNSPVAVELVGDIAPAIRPQKVSSSSCLGATTAARPPPRAHHAPPA